MTAAQIYFFVAPVVLLLVVASATYWWLHRPYPEDSKHKPQ